MTFVFVFLGEFGYELLNWQGVVRKFADDIQDKAIVIACSRAGLDALYELADRYLDISTVRDYRRSVARGYFAVVDPDSSIDGSVNRQFDARLRRRIKANVVWQLQRRSSGSRTKRLLFDVATGSVRWVFSSSVSEVRGCRFGSDRARFGREPAEGNIYERLDLSNNTYRAIEPGFDLRHSIEEVLGIHLTEPYVLCQARTRSIVVRDSVRVDAARVVEKLAARAPVVFLTFDTGRRLDSVSHFAETVPGCHLYRCSDFRSQSCLIHFADSCVFFTEGDFGSHAYVPPFLGKNCYVLAPRGVYDIGTTPIRFWNDKVFRFGGHLIPKVAEDTLRSSDSITAFVDEVLGA